MNALVRTRATSPAGVPSIRPSSPSLVDGTLPPRAQQFAAPSKNNYASAYGRSCSPARSRDARVPNVPRAAPLASSASAIPTRPSSGVRKPATVLTRTAPTQLRHASPGQVSPGERTPPRDSYWTSPTAIVAYDENRSKLSAASFPPASSADSTSKAVWNACCGSNSRMCVSAVMWLVVLGCSAIGFLALSPAGRERAAGLGLGANATAGWADGANSSPSWMRHTLALAAPQVSLADAFEAERVGAQAGLLEVDSLDLRSVPAPSVRSVGVMAFVWLCFFWQAVTSTADSLAASLGLLALMLLTAPLWWLLAPLPDRTAHIWVRGFSALLPLALVSLARAASGQGASHASSVGAALRHALAGRWTMWLVWLLLELTLLVAALYHVLSGLWADGAQQLLPFTQADLADEVYNGLALVLLALALPMPSAEQHGERWRIEASPSRAFCADLPLWWVVCFSSANLAFVYRLGSQALPAHAVLTLASLAYALVTRADRWLHSWLVGMAVQTVLVLVSGQDGLFTLTLALEAELAQPRAAVIAAWSKANCVLVVCALLAVILDPVVR